MPSRRVFKGAQFFPIGGNTLWRVVPGWEELSGMECGGQHLSLAFRKGWEPFLCYCDKTNQVSVSSAMNLLLSSKQMPTVLSFPIHRQFRSLQWAFLTAFFGREISSSSKFKLKEKKRTWPRFRHL